MVARQLGATETHSLTKFLAFKNPVLGLSLAMTAGGLVLFTAVALYKRGDPRLKMYKTSYTIIRQEDVDDPKKLGDIYN